MAVRGHERRAPLLRKLRGANEFARTDRLEDVIDRGQQRLADVKTGEGIALEDHDRAAVSRQRRSGSGPGRSTTDDDDVTVEAHEGESTTQASGFRPATSADRARPRDDPGDSRADPGRLHADRGDPRDGPAHPPDDRGHRRRATHHGDPRADRGRPRGGPADPHGGPPEGGYLAPEWPGPRR